VAAQQDERVAAVLAQDARRAVDRQRIDRRRCARRQRLADHAAFAPGHVGRQDQGGDLAREGLCRLHGLRGVAAERRGVGAGAQPLGDGLRHAGGVCRQRRIEGAVAGGLVAHDVDDAAARPPRVVQVAHAVGQPGAAVQQGAGRLARDAEVAVGHSRHDVLLQPQHAFQARDLVERGHEVHLARARVGEAGLHAGEADPSTLRLSFTAPSVADIGLGVQRIVQAWQALRSPWEIER